MLTPTVALSPSVFRAELTPDARSALLDLQNELAAPRFSGVQPVPWTEPQVEQPPEVYLGAAGGPLYPVGGTAAGGAMQF